MNAFQRQTMIETMFAAAHTQRMTRLALDTAARARATQTRPLRRMARAAIAEACAAYDLKPDDAAGRGLDIGRR